MSKKPLDALKGLGEAISASLTRLSGAAVTIIAKETEQSPVTIRNLDLTRDIQEFVVEMKDDFCKIFGSLDGETADTIDNFSVMYKLEELGTNELFGIRNTILTNQPATASPKLRPKFFLGPGKTRRIGKHLEKNWPFSARKFAKDFIVEQIGELLGIWAENECEIPFVREKIVQFRKQSSKNFNRSCNILIFGRGVEEGFHTVVAMTEGLLLRLEELATEKAIENAETAIDIYEESDNWQLRRDGDEILGWLGTEPGAWEGPEIVESFEKESNITWEWKIEATCDSYCYQETSDKGFEIGCD